MAKQLKTLRLILGDQLNYKHSWFSKNQENVTYLMMEMRQETDYVVHHIQKVIGFFSAMRNFAHHMSERNHQFIYLKINDDKN
ncbi:MAG: cryptochrome/photolyase family protein, partial [Gramella sp.]|nr:cryptochrome/photolyase family protein [Christiangramia sp.]